MRYISGVSRSKARTERNPYKVRVNTRIIDKFALQNDIIEKGYSSFEGITALEADIPDVYQPLTVRTCTPKTIKEIKQAPEMTQPLPDNVRRGCISSTA